MSDQSKPTIESLQQRREACLQQSEAARLRLPKVYFEIKAMLKHVIQNPVDITDYYEIALRLSELLEAMGPGTLFHEYYLQNIHPQKWGDPRFFRAQCRDLQGQIELLDEWRLARRKLSVVK